MSLLEVVRLGDFLIGKNRSLLEMRSVKCPLAPEAFVDTYSSLSSIWREPLGPT